LDEQAEGIIGNDDKDDDFWSDAIQKKVGSSANVMCLPGSLGFFVDAMADFFGLSKLSGLELAGSITEVAMVV
jgi:hypothetical protein